MTPFELVFLSLEFPAGSELLIARTLHEYRRPKAENRGARIWILIVALETKVNIVSYATKSIQRECALMKAFSLSSFLPYRLAVLSQRISHRLSLEYGRSHGLSVPEWRVLVHLSRCKAVSVREIHNCVNLEKPAVSRAVSKLEAARLVRKVPDRDDSRLVKISLTKAGNTALADILPSASAMEDRLLAALSEDERVSFNAVIEKLHAVLDADPEAKRRSHMDTEDQTVL